MTFLCDQNLGRLSRWLRMMGYDARYLRSWDEEQISEALAAGRIFLTRKRSMAGREGCLVIENDRLDGQIAFLESVLELEKNAQPFSRCSICNLPLKCAKREDVENQVPEYISATHGNFAICPGCSRIYWKGTHPARAMASMHAFMKRGKRNP